MREVKDTLYAQVARIGQALASPKRLELLELLCQGEKAVETLAQQAEISVKLASAHLRELRLARLVDTRKEGKYVVYRLADGGVAELWVKLREQAEEKLSQLKGVPLVAVSGLTGEGLDRLMQAILDAYAVWNKRVPTNALNRWFEEALSAHPPPAVSGRRLKINYITQAKARPPTFILFCTRADAIPDIYIRYLVNGLRETFDMPGTPISPATCW